MRHLSEIPTNRLNRSWFDHTADWSIDSERSAFLKTLARGAVSGKTAFCFLLPDEKLLGRSWVLIRIAADLRRIVATTL
jgi:hypothetical protein